MLFMDCDDYPFVTKKKTVQIMIHHFDENKFSLLLGIFSSFVMGLFA